MGLAVHDVMRHAAAHSAPRIESFARVFDNNPENGYQPLVSDHAGLLGAYSFR